MKSQNFKCNVLYWPPIITFTCKSLKSEIFSCNVLYWLPINTLHAKVWNLKFSCVMCSIDLQLSLLHAKVWNLKISVVMFSTDYQLTLYIILELVIFVQLSLFTCKRKSDNFQLLCSLLTSNYHFYMLKYEIWNMLQVSCSLIDLQLSLLQCIWMCKLYFHVSTDLQLSLLLTSQFHSKIWYFHHVLFSTDLQLSLLYAKLKLLQACKSDNWTSVEKIIHFKCIQMALS